MDRADHLLGSFGKISRRKGLAWIGYINQVVRDIRTLLRGWFGSADIHAAINLHRIGIEDLGPHFARQGQGKIAFA